GARLPEALHLRERLRAVRPLGQRPEVEREARDAPLLRGVEHGLDLLVIRPHLGLERARWEALEVRRRRLDARLKRGPHAGRSVSGVVIRRRRVRLERAAPERAERKERKERAQETRPPGRFPPPSGAAAARHSPSPSLSSASLAALSPLL